MKVSILITYYNRKNLLKKTLDSIIKSKYINDTEILIVDDASSEKNRIEDLIEKYNNYNITIFRFEKKDKWWNLQIPPHNKLISMATGDIIIQQGAECYHSGDIIKDAIKNIKDNMYRVYGCYALNQQNTKELYFTTKNDYILEKKNNVGFSFEKGGWYQHSVLNNRCLNFCTAITKKDLLELGGFDERFSNVLAFGDNEFILRIVRKKMNIVCIDDLYVYHQFHEPMKSNKKNELLENKNADLYFNKVVYETKIKVHNSFLNDLI